MVTVGTRLPSDLPNFVEKGLTRDWGACSRGGGLRFKTDAECLINTGFRTEKKEIKGEKGSPREGIYSSSSGQGRKQGDT